MSMTCKTLAGMPGFFASGELATVDSPCEPGWADGAESPKGPTIGLSV